MMPWLDSNGGLIANPTTGLVAGCLCPPCVRGWDIVSLCYLHGPCSETPDRNTIDLIVDAEGTACAYKYAVLPTWHIETITHETFPAPHDGEVKWWMTLNGVPMMTPETVSMTEGNPISVVNEAGYNLDAGPYKITFWFEFWGYDDAVPEPNLVLVSKSSSSICVLSWDMGETFSLHQVAIVPHLLFNGEEIVGGPRAVDTNLAIQKLLGPFDTMAEAGFVYDTWEDTILEYARKCLCPWLCEADGSGAVSGVDEPPDPETRYFIGDALIAGGGEDGVSFVGNACETALLCTVEIGTFVGTHGTPHVKVMDASQSPEVVLADWTTTGTYTFIIPACAEPMIYLYPEGGWLDTLTMNVKWGNGAEDLCGLVDPAADPPVDLWTYNDADDTGVPATQAQLDDWRSEQEYAKVESELPERFV